MIIRQATIQDTQRIRLLLGQLGYPDLNESAVEVKVENYRQPDYHLMVGEIENIVVAFIALHWFDIFHSPGKIGRITAFCVDETQRSQGTGRAMLASAETFLKNKGCTKIEVTSKERRTRTHAFYKTCGYTENARRFVKDV